MCVPHVQISIEIGDIQILIRIGDIQVDRVWRSLDIAWYPDKSYICIYTCMYVCSNDISVEIENGILWTMLDMQDGR